MNRLPLLLLALLFAAPTFAQNAERIVEEDGNQVLIERTRPDGSVSRYWTSRQSFAERGAREARRQANRRRQCDRKLANLHQQMSNLGEIERLANADCSDAGDADARQYCEELRRVNREGIPARQDAVKYARSQANLVCASTVLGSARPQSLPANLETAARDVLFEALERVLTEVLPQ